MKRFLSLLLIITFLFSGTGCATTTTYTHQAQTIKERPSGIYVGGISFAGDVTDITGGKPVFLNQEGRMFLERAILARYQVDSAANVSLYDALEKTISLINDQAESFPDDVESVNLVVFTNRLPSADTGDPSLPTMKAAGKDVTLYAIGSPQFTAPLNRLAGDPSRIYPVEEDTDIPLAFFNIAAQLSQAPASSVVYFVLDAAPPLDEDELIWVQYSSVSFLDILGENIDMSVSTPVTKLLVDPNTRRSVAVSWDTTFGIWVGVLLSIGMLVGAFALFYSIDS